MKRRRWSLALLPLAFSVVGLVPSAPASADPGTCAYSGAIADSAPTTAYQLKNRCSFTINARAVLPSGYKFPCRTLGPYGFTWYTSNSSYSWFRAEAC